jgi:uncharacterized protein (DUF486 family)
MNSTVLASKTRIAAIALDSSRGVSICMLAGAALLVAGCWTGLADAQARTLVLCLLSGGIAMFAAALVLLRRRPGHDAVGASAPKSTGQKVLAAPIATPLDTGTAEPLQLRQEVAAVEPRPSAATAILQTNPAAATVNETRPVEGVLDVTVLMDAPLTDLLLAALCKDPVGARRIFAKALEPGAAPVAPRVPSTCGATVPSATSSSGDTGAVAIGPATTAAS